MKKKQIIGLVVAALVFVFVCASSVISNAVAKKTTDSYMSEGISAFTNGLDTVTGVPLEDNFAVVRVEGSISEDLDGYGHAFAISTIDELIDSESNKGMLLYINSPGGSVTASDKLYLKLMEYKQLTGRPIWVYMDDMAASGGYYIAMAGDRILANRNCWTGSIGVYVGITNYAGLYDKLGIDSIYITTGDNKTMGSSTEEMTEEQRAIYQSLVDEAFDQFVSVIVEGRGLSEERVREIGDGRVYTAKQALEIGLIDKVTDTYEEVLGEFDSYLGGGLEIYEPIQVYSILDELSRYINAMFPRSEAQIAADMMENSGEAMYEYKG